MEIHTQKSVRLWYFGSSYTCAFYSGASYCQCRRDTYQNGDCLLCRRFGSFEKGDVIICTTDEGKTLIKRIIGTSGDTIDIDFESGIVKVNGKALDEPYIKEITHHDEGSFEYPITVPENCYFVMGDNRNYSSDSRKYGYIKEENIKGKVLCEIPFI